MEVSLWQVLFGLLFAGYLFGVWLIVTFYQATKDIGVPPRKSKVFLFAVFWPLVWWFFLAQEGWVWLKSLVRGR